MTSNFKFVQLFISHFIFLIILYCFLNFLGVIQLFPLDSNVIQWDAGWYKSIVDGGYLYKENEQSNTGFFPLFPIAWKYLNFSNLGISFLNLVLFFIGVFFISRSFKTLNRLTILLSLSFPSLFFMYVPYSEATFFLIASLYLYGNYTSKDSLKITALLLASLARPTIFFFLPAVVFSELLSNDKISYKIKKIIIYLIFIILGTSISFYIIGYESGNLFAYSDSQIKNWSHTFSIPKLPLTTWRGYRIMWIDFLGLWVVVLSFILSLNYFLNSLRNKRGLKEHKNLLLSVSYYAMVLVYVMFFHPKEKSTGLTTILSLNRYVFCSPFVFYMFYTFYQDNTLIKYKYFISSLLISLILIGVPYHEIEGLNYIKTLFFSFLIIAFLVLQFLPKIFKLKYVYIAVYIVNSCLQLYLFQSFLKGNWIG